MSTKKTIVITGVTRGIGKGLMENLANCDSCQTVIGICRDSPQFNELKNKFGGNAKVKLFNADVANFDSLNHVVQSLHQENIHPDMVCFSHSYQSIHPVGNSECGDHYSEQAVLGSDAAGDGRVVRSECAGRLQYNEGVPSAHER